MKNNLFDVLFLIGRPAAGKSEVIDYLKKTGVSERKRRFHIGDFKEIDDFPMIWEWFEEDGILSEMGKPRLHTDEEGYFLYGYLWNVLIRRLDLEYSKLSREDSEKGVRRTYIVEFSRGSEHGGYREAFRHFSMDLLSKASVLYIDVSFEESLRKNRRRFNPDKPYSILEHALPDSKLKRLYGEVDWEDFSAGDDRYIRMRGLRIPYAVFDNSDDVTTRGGEELGDRLETVLSLLWQRRESIDTGGR